MSLCLLPARERERERDLSAYLHERESVCLYGTQNDTPPPLLVGFESKKSRSLSSAVLDWRRRRGAPKKQKRVFSFENRQKKRRRRCKLREIHALSCHVFVVFCLRVRLDACLCTRLGLGGLGLEVVVLVCLGLRGLRGS